VASPAEEIAGAFASAEPVPNRTQLDGRRGWMSGLPRIVCLLPVHNGESYLPGYLESVGRFADTVVALDDGSTDGTARILNDSPLVSIVLSNPPRPGYAGWDDAANRRRLLAAAAAVAPDWVISLDVDERVSADDVPALRALVARDAIPGFAYGFLLFQMLEDERTYDAAPLWVYRLFHYSADYVFPEKRLHLIPVPTAIPPERWLRTTIRIQHFGAIDEPHRIARFAKYREADPHNVYQDDYSHLLRTGAPVAWEERPSGLPPLLPEREDLLDELGLNAPALSAIVIAQNDEATIEETVRSILDQESRWSFEVILVTSGSDRTADIVRERFPEVEVVALDRPALPGEARNAGLRLARGDYVTFPGSHVTLPQGSFAHRIAAHELGFAMVTGTTLNGTHTPAGWASYFMDHSIVLPGMPSGELAMAPAHCSYTRECLLAVGGFPEHMRAGEDTVVNRKLTALGYRTYREQAPLVVHHSRCRTPARLLRHHFVRGRWLGRILLDERRDTPRPFDAKFIRGWLFGLVPRRIRKTTENVERWGGELGETYRKVYPLVVLGVLASWLGLWVELLRPEAGKLRLFVRSLDPLVARLALRARIARARTIEDALDLAFDFRYRRLQIEPWQERTEIAALLERLRLKPPRTVVEIGTAGGGSLFLFTRVASDDAVIVSLDLHGGRFGGGYDPSVMPLYRSFARKRQRVELVRGDSHDPAALAEVRRRLAGREIDFLFIDADHTYEGVKRDFEMYRPLVRRGGLVAFHDIVPGPEKTVGGVPHFWKELKASARWQVDEYVADWRQGRAGIGLVRIPGG
jgi:glycosyltransferase involved in cell wall biosynthesis